MTLSYSPKRSPIVVALYANAAMLLLILLVIFGRSLASGGLSWADSPAFGQQAQPSAGGGALFLMPAQLSSSTWGCYILDANAQTLTAYQYYSGDKLLRLVAARSIRHDRQLASWHTEPAPAEVQQMVERERSGQGVAPTASATTQASP